MTDEISDEELPSQNTGATYLKGAEIAGKVVDATITEVTELKTFSDGRKGRSLVVDIRGTPRMVGLNKKNMATLVSAFGKRYTDWVGKQISIGTTKVTNPSTGVMTDGLVLLVRE